MNTFCMILVFTNGLLVIALMCAGIWLDVKALKPRQVKPKGEDELPPAAAKGFDEIAMISADAMNPPRRIPINFDVKVRLEKRTGSNIYNEYVPVSEGHFDRWGALWITVDYWPEIAPWRDTAMKEFRSKLRSHMLANGRGVPQIDALLDCAEQAACEALHPQTYVEKYHGNR